MRAPLHCSFRPYIGIKESPPNSNHVIFNTRFYGRPISGPKYPWCVVSMWSGFQDAKAPELFYGGGKCASCGELRRYAIAHGQWVTSGYREGDLPIYDFEEDGNLDTDHIGWIDQVLPDGTFITLEGNTSGEGMTGSQSDGGMFAERHRNKRYITGAIRPKYESEDDGKAGTPAAEKPLNVLLKKGSKGKYVRTLQARLNELGYNCGAVDGDFWTNTLKAVIRFQSTKKLDPDGVVGPKTWQALSIK